MTDLAELFQKPTSRHHKRYEILRAAFVENIPLRIIAERFGYAYGTIRNLCSQFRKTPHLDCFLPDSPSVDSSADPKPDPSAAMRIRIRRNQRILQLREELNLSVVDICEILENEKLPSSPSNIGRILRESGFKKLPRRTLKERLDAVPIHRAATADCRKLDLSTRQFTTDFGGLFLFARDLVHMDLDGLLKDSKMPGSTMIPAGCAVRALLALKLWGIRRPSHVMDDVLDPGLALFAGLNAMPKVSSLTEYSCRVHPDHLRRLLEQWHGAARTLDVSLGAGTSFDLDFHTIPYHGDDALAEKHFVSKRSRSQKGILSLVVRDVDARLFVYADANVRKNNRQQQLMQFVDFWRERTGKLPREVVFDSTFTTYAQLQKLNELGIDFLTLRRRSKKIVTALQQTPPDQWKRIRLTNVGRTFRNPRILEERIRVRDYNTELRQIAITDLGHDEPTLLITNQMKTAAGKLIDRYARRMIIENTIADAIDFFHMDALSSSVPLKIEVDLQLTLMASTLYRLLALRVGRGMETAKPRTLFRKLIRNQAKIQIRPDDIVVTLSRRANNPYLLAAGYMEADDPIPWLDNRRLRIQTR